MANTKSELDKEIMYRKIMPTRVKGTKAPVQSSSLPETGADHTPEKHTEMVSGGVNRTSAAKRQIRETQDMVLVNAMEELVLSKLDGTIARFNCCKCNKCKKDVAAIALNRLPPRYIVIKDNDPKKLQAAEEEYGAAVTSALVQAILIVKKSPRH